MADSCVNLDPEKCVDSALVQKYLQTSVQKTEPKPITSTDGAVPKAAKLDIHPKMVPERVFFQPSKTLGKFMQTAQPVPVQEWLFSIFSMCTMLFQIMCNIWTYDVLLWFVIAFWETIASKVISVETVARPLALRGHQPEVEQEDASKFHGHQHEVGHSEAPISDLNNLEQNRYEFGDGYVTPPQSPNMSPRVNEDDNNQKLKPNDINQPAEQDKLEPDGIKQPKQDKLEPDGVNQPPNQDKLEPDGVNQPPKQDKLENVNQPPNKLESDGKAKARVLFTKNVQIV